MERGGIPLCEKDVARRSGIQLWFSLYIIIPYCDNAQEVKGLMERQYEAYDNQSFSLQNSVFLSGDKK